MTDNFVTLFQSWSYRYMHTARIMPWNWLLNVCVNVQQHQQTISFENKNIFFGIFFLLLLFIYYICLLLLSCCSCSSILACVCRCDRENFFLRAKRENSLFFYITTTMMMKNNVKFFFIHKMIENVKQKRILCFSMEKTHSIQLCILFL